jgi:hypothetical protein
MIDYNRLVDFKLQTSDFGLWTLDFGLWILDFGLWTLDFGLWTLDFGLWTLDFGLWTLDFGQCVTHVSALHTTRSPPPPPCYTLYKYIDLHMYLFTQRRWGGGGGEPVRRLEGQYFTRGVENIN